MEHRGAAGRGAGRESAGAGAGAGSGGAPLFLSPEWVDRVRAAVDAVPDPGVRAEKLAKYADWIERARSGYTATWVLGVRDPHPEVGAGKRADLVLEWADGSCVRAETRAHSGAPRSYERPDPADYAISADYAAWRDLVAGEEPGRLLMYRRMVLEHGDALLFFRRVYLVVESLAALARVPVRLP